MVASSQTTGEVLFVCSVILSFILLVAVGLWCNRLWKLRGYHVKDFRRLLTEAKMLNAETLRVRREVDADFVDASAKVEHVAILDAAAEWDTDLRIALGTWEDVMFTQPDVQSSDLGSEEKGEKIDHVQRKAHARSVIELMRAKCMDALEKRKHLSPQLQEIHSEVTSRYVATSIQMSRGKGVSGVHLLK